MHCSPCYHKCTPAWVRIRNLRRLEKTRRIIQSDHQLITTKCSSLQATHAISCSCSPAKTQIMSRNCNLSTRQPVLNTQSRTALGHSPALRCSPSQGCWCPQVGRFLTTQQCPHSPSPLFPTDNTCGANCFRPFRRPGSSSEIPFQITMR